MHRLPPLRAIQVFDSVARNQSFSIAASQLAITQGAVSKQVKLLEEFYAEKLFIRCGTNIELTKKGTWLAYQLTPIFDQLNGICNFNSISRGKIRIATYPSLSLGYLTYEIEQFNSAHPNIDVEIILAINHPTMCDEIADLFITTEESIDGYHYQQLFQERLIPVISPKIINDTTIIKIKDLTGYTLLVTNGKENSDWQLWFNHHNLKPAIYQKMNMFSDALLSTRAAELGNGIALSCEVTAHRDIIDGRLCKVGLPSAPTGRRYFLCCKNRRRYEPNIKLLSDWINKKFINDQK